MNEPRRTARVLLDLLGEMPEELISIISPEAGLKLKKSIKVPVVLLTMAAGLCGGTSLVMMKSFGEIVGGAEMNGNVYMAVVLIIFGLGTGALQMYMLNLSMKYYNNIDVMPIYQSFILINWMVSGLVLLDESSLYSWGELLRLAASCSLVISGIFVLTLKQTEIVSNHTQVNQPLISLKQPDQIHSQNLKVKDEEEEFNSHLSLVREIF